MSRAAWWGAVAVAVAGLAGVTWSLREMLVEGPAPWSVAAVVASCAATAVLGARFGTQATPVTTATEGGVAPVEEAAGVPGAGPDVVYEAVMDLLSRFDPEELLATGAPVDEYHHEAQDLAVLVRADAPIRRGDVARVWDRWFGAASTFLATGNEDEVAGLADALEELRVERVEAAAPTSPV